MTTHWQTFQITTQERLSYLSLANWVSAWVLEHQHLVYFKVYEGFPLNPDMGQYKIKHLAIDKAASCSLPKRKI